MTISISIVVPVYKVSKFITKCIESILAQTYTNFEVILIDDGSPDNSINLAKKAIQNDSRFIILSKENGGQGSARNMGIDNARGQYITFIDSDDYVEPDFLQSMYTEIRTTNADICLCNANIVNTNGITINTIDNNVEKYKEENDFLLCRNSISSFMWDKLFKKEVFFNMRFDPNIRTYEDSHFVFRLIYGKKITSINKHLYNYVQRDGSTTNSFNKTYIKDKTSVMNTYMRFAEQNFNTKNFDNYLTYCYLKFYIYTVAVGLARYSPSYKKDISTFKSRLTIKKLSLRNIFFLFKDEKKIKMGLLIFYYSPRLFKLIINLRDLKKND